MTLFTKGDPAGLVVDADAFNDDDIATLASSIARIAGPFAQVEAVEPTGARLAAALEEHKTSYGSLLIVDVVCVDGAALEAQRAGRDPTTTVGVVVFNQGDLPVWCRALFTAHVTLRG